LIDDCHLYNHVFTLSKRDSTTDPTATTTSSKKKAFSIEGVLDPPHPPAESLSAGSLIYYLRQHPIAELLQLNTIDAALPWIMAGLAPWRGAVHPNPPKKEPKFLASLIVKHELMYDEKKRDVVADTFEKGKMEIIKEAATQNQLHEMSRYDAGMSHKIGGLIAVVLIRKLGPHWRIITFTLLLYELIPHTSKSTKNHRCP